MFATFLSYLNVTVVVGAVSFFAGVILSQKVKDWIKGVPNEVRSKLSAAETAVLAHIKASNADMVNTALVALGNTTSPAKMVSVPVAPPAA